ncbi:hypothetical protein [Sphingomonas xanthus]|uniref:Uncharacterized protein n=1 Tax=Sphingomonas xanthus TaxID=2594473 RepID=A0A516IU04_9SPHN|nr:hypothetical protein [Sphingomonas xanthus]QDP20361.1 hypothetical protein FMM02_10600 [Sphingomonas xanthus]
MLYGLIGLFILFFLTMPMSRRRHRWLWRKRGQVDFDRFERAMRKSGVSPTTIRFLWRELEPFYHEPLRPLPKDRLESQIMIDRPEIEALILHFWRSMRGQDALPSFSAVGPDPTVAQLGRHLDLMAGWTIRSAA